MEFGLDARVGVECESCAQRGCRSGWHELAVIVSEDRFTRRAEDLLGGSVELDEVTIRVHGEDGVRGRLEDGGAVFHCVGEAPERGPFGSDVPREYRDGFRCDGNRDQSPPARLLAGDPQLDLAFGTVIGLERALVDRGGDGVVGVLVRLGEHHPDGVAADGFVGLAHPTVRLDDHPVVAARHPAHHHEAAAEPVHRGAVMRQRA